MTLFSKSLLSIVVLFPAFCRRCFAELTCLLTSNASCAAAGDVDFTSAVRLGRTEKIIKITFSQL